MGDDCSSEQHQPTEPQLPQTQGNRSKDRSQRTRDHRHDKVSESSSEPNGAPTTTGSPRSISREPDDSIPRLSLDTAPLPGQPSRTQKNTRNGDSVPRASETSDRGSIIPGSSLPSATGVEVVMKSVELESPNTILRNRKLHRGTYPTGASGQPHKPSHPDDNPPTDSAGVGVAPYPMKRKPSLSSVRGHVPSGINTDPGTFAMCVHESSPVGTSLKHAPLVEEKSPEDDPIDVNESDFDWEEEKIYEDMKKEAQGNSAERNAMMESDVCCRPLHRRIHPWITQLIKNLAILLFFLSPKLLLHHFHTHHHKVIILIEDGRPYTAVVLGNHLGYFVIQFLIMALFKLIHKFGTVKVKITLETHDGLVPDIARSVWLFVLTAFWAVFVHQPTCNKAKGGLGFPESIEQGVDRQCRKWVFWWVYRCLWGIQAMNLLYILKRYIMQILSDRFDQDNSKFVELNFQGHVLDGLQKIKQHRHHRMSGLHSHHYRWLATYQGGRSPSASRPNSSKDEKPPTASVVEATTLKRSSWELLKNSFWRRTRKRTGTQCTGGGGGTTIGSASSPSDTMVDSYRDHELEPQEFVRMSKKRKSKLIHSLRNKPIENPYKKAKDLWTRICPPHRNHLERVDLEPPFRKEIMDRIWKLFDPNGDDIVTRTMFKKTIVDMVNLRKSFTSTHKAFENAMAKLNMLFNIIFLLFVIVAFLIAYDVGVQQYAVGVSSLVVGCAFVTGTSAKNAFESMVFIFIMGFYFTILTIHILTTELKRGDGLSIRYHSSLPNEHIDNFYMDIPLFSTARTIQRLKQKIQTFVEGESVTDYHKIDVIVNATNNHTKDGTSKACLQILFRVFYRCRWVDSDYAGRKLRAVLFLRGTLSELEQEDLNDLIALRRAIGYGNHSPQENPSNEDGSYPPAQPLNQTVLSEATEKLHTG
ncbi:hypothetical protein BGX31_009662 [Mortierella sp. GBA43]|nr:hypothetical protein BGX31_009662 [Mortierella sp. GBA43]